MADDEPPELVWALLQWIRTFSLSRPVDNWEDLRDGKVFWTMLQDIDPDYFVDALPELVGGPADNWIPRWQNLKHINRLVTSYSQDVCGTLEDSTGDMMPDLKAIARDSSGHDTVVLLKNILRAAMYSPQSNQRMGRIVVGLGPDVAKPIAAAMAQMEELDQQSAEARHTSAEIEVTSEQDALNESDLDQSTRGTSVERDSALEQEERLILAYKLIKQLETTHAQAAAELEELRQEKDTLNNAFESFKHDVDSQAMRRTESDEFKQLQTTANRSRDYIAELESELESTRATAESHERQLERLKNDSDGKQKLRDDLQLLRAERDELVQKSRTSENLKKKIQTLQDQEKHSATLREDLQAANEQLQSFGALKEQCAALQKTNVENMTIIANGEQEIFDQKTSKKRLEHEYNVLLQRWETAKESQARDYETITELESRLQAFQDEDDNASPSVERSGLGDELAATEKASTTQQLSGTYNAALYTDAVLVQQRLDSITLRNVNLESQYLDLLQDKLGLETAISDLREPSKQPEETVPFLEQRKKLQSAQHDLSQLKGTCFSITAELASVKERLLASQEQQDVEALDADTEYQTLTIQYTELAAHSHSLQSDLEEHEALLRHALLSHAALLKEDDSVRSSNEYKLVIQQLEAVRVREDATNSDILTDAATALTSKIEAGRVASILAAKRAEEHELVISELKVQLNAATRRAEAAAEIAAASAAPQSQPSHPHWDSLQRENRLMTSAWYDLNTRLQSNTVMLGRRQEEPKSWIGKQRALVSHSVLPMRR